jgi:hypothetical protein
MKISASMKVMKNNRISRNLGLNGGEKWRNMKSRGGENGEA